MIYKFKNVFKIILKIINKIQEWLRTWSLNFPHKAPWRNSDESKDAWDSRGSEQLYDLGHVT